MCDHRAFDALTTAASSRADDIEVARAGFFPALYRPVRKMVIPARYIPQRTSLPAPASPHVPVLIDSNPFDTGKAIPSLPVVEATGNTFMRRADYFLAC